MGCATVAGRVWRFENRLVIRLVGLGGSQGCTSVIQLESSWIILDRVDTGWLLVILTQGDGIPPSISIESSIFGLANSCAVGFQRSKLNSEVANCMG